MSNPVISVQNLTKNFETQISHTGRLSTLKNLISPIKVQKNAVDDISFEISAGEFVGFIGPNGAGKTTTLKMLSGILYPSNGIVKVEGFTPFERKGDFLRQISLVMGQKSQLNWNLPATDTFEVNKAIYEIPSNKYKKQLDFLTELFDAEKFLQTPVRQLSLGQRMKAELISALIHEPKILFLDEPTIGLDIIAGENMRDFLKKYNSETGATIILTSHYMKDVEELCSRLVVINFGKIVYDGKIGDIIENKLSGKILTFTLEMLPDLGEVKKMANILLAKNKTLKIEVQPKDLSQILTYISQNSKIHDISTENVPLEDTIKNMYLDSFTSNDK